MTASGLRTPFGALELVETYFYYDFPMQFAAISNTAELFLVQWIGEQQSTQGHDWLLLPVSRARLEEIRRGMWDLQAAFRNSEEGVVYLIHTGLNSIPMRVLPAASLELPFLPPADMRCDESGPLPNLPYQPAPRTYEQAAE